MRQLLLLCLLFFPAILNAGTATESEVSVAELAANLGFESRKLNFVFDRPVIAECWMETKSPSETTNDDHSEIYEPASRVSISYIIRPTSFPEKKPDDTLDMWFNINGSGLRFRGVTDIFVGTKNITIRPPIAQATVGQNIVLYLRFAAYPDFSDDWDNLETVMKKTTHYQVIRASFKYAPPSYKPKQIK